MAGYEGAPYVAVIDMDTMRLMGIIDVYTSLSDTRRCREPGEWEISLPATSESISLMRIGRMVRMGERAGIIERVELTQGAGGADELRAGGCDLSGLMRWRLALPVEGAEYATYSGTPGQVMAAIVRDNCIDSPIAARNYPQLTLGTVDNSGESIVWQARYELVSDALEQIALLYGMRWGVRLDGTRLRLDIERCTDRSVSQAVRAPVIYSPDYDNVIGQAYVHDVSTACNQAIVAGRGQGAEREVCWVGEGLSGLKRRECYLTANKYDDLAMAGLQALARYAPTQSLEGDIVSGGTYRYGEHWDVGDTVTVRHRDWGVSMDVQVTEVTSVYEQDVREIEATFGDGQLTLVDVVRRAIAPGDDERRG